ncbi:hypothetical protein CCP3SC1_450039 [Gammaproteobacteria bacterium]
MVVVAGGGSARISAASRGYSGVGGVGCGVTKMNKAAPDEPMDPDMTDNSSPTDE